MLHGFSGEGSKVDIAPQPEDTHLPQGDEDVNIADFVQDSSSGLQKSSIDFLTCSTDLQDKLPKVDPQGEEVINIADIVQE